MLLGLFVALTIVFASTTYYESTSRVTTSSTSTFTQTTTVTLPATTQVEPCSGQVVWNVNSSSASNIPVLLMQPDSTAYVCVTYQTQWQGNATDPHAPPSNSTFDFGLNVSNEHCTTGPDSFGCASTISNSFVIEAYPASVETTPDMDYVNVLYVVSALGNSTGFYDGSAPFDYCFAMPLAVGYSASQVNGSDFAPRFLHGCPYLFLTPRQVSVSEMEFVNIPLNQFPPVPFQ